MKRILRFLPIVAIMLSCALTSNDRLLKSVGSLIFNYDEKNKLTSITENYRGDIKVSYNPLTFTFSYKEDGQYWM